jgi:hypothetical protein
MNAQDRRNTPGALQARFGQHAHRHAGLAWNDVRARLEAHPEALEALREM